MKENISTFEEDKPLDKKEWEALLGVAGEMVKRLPCPVQAVIIV